MFGLLNTIVNFSASLQHFNSGNNNKFTLFDVLGNNSLKEKQKLISFFKALQVFFFFVACRNVSNGHVYPLNLLLMCLVV